MTHSASSTPPPDHVHNFEDLVLPLLACSLISKLTVEAIYTQNNLSLGVIRGLPPLLLPPQPLRSVMWHVKLEVPFGSYMHSLSALRHFNNLGSDNFHNLDIKASTPNAYKMHNPGGAGS